MSSIILNIPDPWFLSNNFSVRRACIDTSDPWYFSWTNAWLCVTCDIELIATLNSICIELNIGSGQLLGSQLMCPKEPVCQEVRQWEAITFCLEKYENVLQRYFLVRVHFLQMFITTKQFLYSKTIPLHSTSECFKRGSKRSFTISGTSHFIYEFKTHKYLCIYLKKVTTMLILRQCPISTSPPYYETLWLAGATTAATIGYFEIINGMVQATHACR